MYAEEFRSSDVESEAEELDIHIPPNPTFSDEFIRGIPKTDLHLHLDGSVRIQTIIDLSKEMDLKLPADTVEGMKEAVFKDHYKSLEEYLECFSYMTAVMRTPASLERIAYELGCDCYEEGVRYFEARFAPQLLAIPGKLDIATILVSVNRGFKRAQEEYNARPGVASGEEPEYDYGIIVCAMRFFTPEFSPYYAAFCQVHKGEDPHRLYGLASMALVTQSLLAKKRHNLPVVAIDIAGAEEGFPAEDHQEAFRFATKRFLNKTVHAGEGYGAESIFQAVNDLNADRIGHGFHLFNEEFIRSQKYEDNKKEFVQNIANFVANRRVTLEVCITSNLQTIPELHKDARNHEFRKMLDGKLSVTLSTDNRTVSHTNMCKEVRLAVDAFKMTPKQLRTTIINGFKRSFMNRPYAEKRVHTRKVIDYYASLEAKYGIDGAD